MRRSITIIITSVFLFSSFCVLSADEKVIEGLKEALKISIQNSVKRVGCLDGYFKNDAIKILLPKDLHKVEEYLSQVGAEKYIEQFVEKMNRAAEEAVPLAQEIFVDAVKKIQFDDALKILNGKGNEATVYLQEKTTSSLVEKFTPLVRQSMEKVGAVKAYNDLVDKYCQNPLFQKVDLDLNKYVTEKAVDGLFKTVAEEETKIRTDPAARITDLLQNVFSGLTGHD
ncbi:DUF4197 domain-containing protein [bacterium]|nr:DUF4197 domain-containing protein [bacterium]